jgi:hypothetical protein
MKRDVGVAYLLAGVSAFGVAGLHRFYLGKPLTGLLWMLTWGLGGIGLAYDLVTMSGQVARFNHRRQPLALPAAPAIPLSTRILNVVRRHGGRTTPLRAASELGVAVDAAEHELDEMCRHGHANIEVTDDGVIYYDFPALRFA